tara:strand:- start:1357 stop:2016 length:660 start_codon:yes stop_codon:yes gene_type:complete
MASTFTTNSGIEKPGSGEQAGAWGTTVNTNFDIIDRALNGVVTLTLTGTTTTLTTTDGQLSDGHHKVLVLSGSPSGTNTITISPNDQDKLYFVQNNSGQNAIFSQGSGANATVNNGESAIIFADGAGSGAAVTDFSSVLAAPTDLVNDTSPQLGGDLDANSNDILMGNQSVKFGTSKWEIVLDTGDNDLLFKYNGTTVFKLSSAGAVVASDNITAYGSP